MKSQILRGDSPIFELDRGNFQQVLDLGFSETSQSLSSFKQLLFFHFIGGTKGKKSKNCESPQKSGSSFPNRDPLSTTQEATEHHFLVDLSNHLVKPGLYFISIPNG